MGCWMHSGFHRNDAMVAGRSHSRLLASGNVLSKPLDSGLRRNDDWNDNKGNAVIIE